MSYSRSPTLRLLGASPIVTSAVEWNQYLFLPRGPRPSTKASTSPYDRVLVMHLCRGDVALACENFALYSSRFNGWNQLEFLPDRLVVPDSETERRRRDVYRKRCSPDFSEIVEKVTMAIDMEIIARLAAVFVGNGVVCETNFHASCSLVN
ncbi:hypothetical protein BDZ89DRAFT_970950 [Hymenopellis radicata]|nr:hypothetical protein BDZ89DRAFT_970950 [Hymenopellis radicata]